MKRLLLLILLTSYHTNSQTISSIDVIQNANDFLNHTWTVHSNNITTGTYTSLYSCSDASQKYVVTPDWVSTANNPLQSIPYKWGGFSSLQQFDSGIANGKFAGDIQTRHPNNTSVHYSCGTPAAVGLDCSGFTSRCYELSSHVSTYGMAHSSSFGFYNSYNDIQPGDIANKSGSHVRLVVHINANGTINTIEEGAGNNLWRIFPATYSTASLLNYGYNPQYYVNMSHDGESRPDNDECINAEYLISHTSCNLTQGSLTGAHDDNLPLAACDNFTGNDSGKGVFYKFLATESTHQITVNPMNNNTNPVIAVYQGDCQNLTEIACSNTSGDGGQEILSYNGFTPGNYYYVRVYNYGNTTVHDGEFNICITHTPTQPAYLLYSMRIISDGLMGGSGNSDGKINPGETINLIFQVYNAGNATAHNVSVSIATSDTDVNILQNTAGCNDIDADETQISGGMEFSINNLAMAHNFNIDVHFHSDEGDWYQNLPLQIIGSDTADVRYAGSFIHDGVGGGIGNYNYQIDAGEQIDLDVYLKNTGAQTAHNVIAVLSTQDPDITITDHQVQWGDILSGETKTGSDFDFTVSSSCPDKDVTFNLLVTSDEGSWDRTIVLHVNNPVSTPQNSLTKVSLYPNPTSDFITINTGNKKIELISIYNTNGQLIHYKFYPGKRIDLRNIPSGWYIVHLKIGEQLLIRKLIKE